MADQILYSIRKTEASRELQQCTEVMMHSSILSFTRKVRIDTTGPFFSLMEMMCPMGGRFLHGLLCIPSHSSWCKLRPSPLGKIPVPPMSGWCLCKDSECFTYIHSHQMEFQIDDYADLRDAVDSDTAHDIRNLVIWISSFTGGPCYMHEKKNFVSILILTSFTKFPSFFSNAGCDDICPSLWAPALIHNVYMLPKVVGNNFRIFSGTES